MAQWLAAMAVGTSDLRLAPSTQLGRPRTACNSSSDTLVWPLQAPIHTLVQEYTSTCTRTLWEPVAYRQQPCGFIASLIHRRETSFLLSGLAKAWACFARHSGLLCLSDLMLLTKTWLSPFLFCVFLSRAEFCF